MGTTVLAEKICGAAAEAGYELRALAGLCGRVNRSGRSMGMALTSCVVPLRGKPTFELGIGIHGVPGRERRTLLDADGRGWKEVRFTSAPIGRGTAFSPS